MELNSIFSSDTAECTYRDPHNGEKTDLVVTVYGMDSEKFREVTKDAARAHAKAKADGKEAPEGPEIEAERLADLTAGWRGLKDGGKDVAFSKSKAIEIYTSSPELRRQVDRFIFQVSNFLPKA